MSTKSHSPSNHDSRIASQSTSPLMHMDMEREFSPLITEDDIILSTSPLGDNICDSVTLDCEDHMWDDVTEVSQPVDNVVESVTPEEHHTPVDASEHSPNTQIPHVTEQVASDHAFYQAPDEPITPDVYPLQTFPPQPLSSSNDRLFSSPNPDLNMYEHVGEFAKSTDYDPNGNDSAADFMQQTSHSDPYQSQTVAAAAALAAVVLETSTTVPVYTRNSSTRADSDGKIKKKKGKKDIRLKKISKREAAKAATAATIAEEKRLAHLANTNQITDDELLVLKPKKKRRAAKFEKPVPSRFCHVCSRTPKNVRLAVCSKIKFGTCRKVICEKCFDQYDYGDFVKALDMNNSEWVCPHCLDSCPSRAQCCTYQRINDRLRIRRLKQDRPRGRASRASRNHMNNNDEINNPESDKSDPKFIDIHNILPLNMSEMRLSQAMELGQELLNVNLTLDNNVHEVSMPTETNYGADVNSGNENAVLVEKRESSAQINFPGGCENMIDISSPGNIQETHGSDETQQFPVHFEQVVQVMPPLEDYIFSVPELVSVGKDLPHELKQEDGGRDDERDASQIQCDIHGIGNNFGIERGDGLPDGTSDDPHSMDSHDEYQWQINVAQNNDFSGEKAETDLNEVDHTGFQNIQDPHVGYILSAMDSMYDIEEMQIKNEEELA